MNKELYRWDSDVNIINIKNFEFELSGTEDKDLMHIFGFATHEGVNENGVKFRREVLQANYKTLIDKPLRILADFFNRPTGHGFDRKTQKFNKDIINIGHIVEVKPVIVGDDEQILCGVENLNDELPDGNYRLMFEAVLYKEYYNDIANVLMNLHDSKQLNFSIESNITYELSEDNIKDCTSIKFIGLSTVKNPEFEKAFSILVAEEERKELDDLDYEKLYNEIKELNDILVSEKEKFISDYEAMSSEKEILENSVKELSASKETLETEIITKNKEISGLAIEVSELNTFKEKFEVSEKEKVGEERLAQIKELGETELSSKEFAEMSDLDFSKVQVECAKNLIESARQLNSVNFDTKLNKNTAGKTLRQALLGGN